ncbi:spindle and kinetochore-associated protein 3 isoform X2 [Sphaerodactylus townsendi]|uniref:spindle and kinetochore-associated protein 3 isoform X2 n=1 Tax=Sphaerodactylus townsendi TaxID=933632 RepID=UPI0020270706|nr:spindle and kinetochore-associated protein 3 isoform X2 [Sphaerodactylus townsendi]
MSERFLQICSDCNCNQTLLSVGSTMDQTGSFFSKLRTFVVTLERQTEQLKQTFHGDETEFEEDSPMRYLHELYSEVRTLKGEADNVLKKRSDERDATCDFIIASKILMNRNTADLGKIRDCFAKYGYQPIIGETATKDKAETDPEPVESDQEELKNLACPENSSEPNPLERTPQLSDFGLSKYALPSTWSTVHILPQPQKEEPRKDYSGCPSPKVEQFHMNERGLCVDDVTACLTEDQTIFLLNNAKKPRQANDKMNGSSMVLASKENLATPRQKSKVHDYDYMASPAAPTFCTPGVKVPPRKNIALPKSPESNQLGASNHTDYMASPAAPTFCTPGVKVPPRKNIALPKSPESNQLDASNHTHPNPQPLEKEPEQAYVIQTVPNKRYVEEAVAPVLPSVKYLDYPETPAPPAVSDYRNTLTSPPPAPEITVIPTQILQILSKYNSNIKAPRFAEKLNNEELSAQLERPALGFSNKENSEYCG